MAFAVDLVRSRLPDRRIEWREITPSTMTVASELARLGCASGTVVGAEQQTAGIGRHGRSWISDAGQGLYVSIVLRHELTADRLPVVMLALGLAAQEAIAGLTGLKPDLRWPNDVLIDGKKCAGMLAQLEGGAIIAGIGINVSQTSFPEGLETPGTSLLLAGAQVAREDLLIALLQAVDRCVARDAAAVIGEFTRASSYVMGRRVRAEHDGRMIEGFSNGLDASGFLILREDNGVETTILAGGVRPA